MRTVKVSTIPSYDILIERGLIKNAGALIKNVTTASKAFVITDT